VDDGCFISRSWFVSSGVAIEVNEAVLELFAIVRGPPRRQVSGTQDAVRQDVERQFIGHSH
jgi:hypothetical protein